MTKEQSLFLPPSDHPAQNRIPAPVYALLDMWGKILLVTSPRFSWTWGLELAYPQTALAWTLKSFCTNISDDSNITSETKSASISLVPVSEGDGTLTADPPGHCLPASDEDTFDPGTAGQRSLCEHNCLSIDYNNTFSPPLSSRVMLDTITWWADMRQVHILPLAQSGLSDACQVNFPILCNIIGENGLSID